MWLRVVLQDQSSMLNQMLTDSEKHDTCSLGIPASMSAAAKLSQKARHQASPLLPLLWPEPVRISVLMLITMHVSHMAPYTVTGSYIPVCYRAEHVDRATQTSAVPFCGSSSPSSVFLP